MEAKEEIKILKKYLKEMIKISYEDYEIAEKHGDNFSQGYREGILITYKDIYKFLERLEREEN